MPLCGPMTTRATSERIDGLRRPEPISIRTARERFGSLVDRVAQGYPVLICRRSTPLAVLLPAAQYEEPETVRREQSLAAILRARGIALDGWTTAGVLEAVAQLLEEGGS